MKLQSYIRELLRLIVYVIEPWILFLSYYLTARSLTYIYEPNTTFREKTEEVTGH